MTAIGLVTAILATMAVSIAVAGLAALVLSGRISESERRELRGGGGLRAGERPDRGVDILR